MCSCLHLCSVWQDESDLISGQLFSASPLRVKMNEDAFEVPERTEYRYLVQEEEEEEVQYVRHRHYINPLLVLSRRCIFLICLGVLALLSLATYLGYVAQTLPPGLAQVSTLCGEFRGRHVS